MIGLDNLDNKILKLLGKEPCYPSEISRELGIFRTTIHYRLSRLAEAGLAKKTLVGRKSIWRPVYRNEHNKSYYQAYLGRDIVQAYKQLLNLPNDSTIFAVQGSLAAKSEFESLPTLFIKEAHRIFKRKNIVMRGILNEGALDLFAKLNKDLVKSHVGRTQSIKMISGNRLSSHGEIMSSEKILLLSNPKSRFVLVIKDPGITKIVNEMFKLLFELLDGNKTFDLNRYLSSRP